jgi:putative tricarboxylic transport membrane protein
VPRIDRLVGIGLAVLALAVLWSARDFPDVPGQKLGAAFLPMIVGAGLLLCALGLIVRGLRGRTHAAAVPQAAPGGEHVGGALVIVGAVAAYLLLAERIGFLLVAPLLLLAVFRALRVGWAQALPWAIGGALVVHLAFYKLLRVPLPWGVITPFY